MAFFGLIETATERRLKQLEQNNHALQRQLSQAIDLQPPFDRLDDMAIWGAGDSGYGRYIATSVDLYACVTLRAENIAKVPIKMYRQTGKSRDQREEIPDHPLLTLLRSVNDQWSQSQLMEMTEQAECVYGQSFWALEEPIRGMPTEIWWLDPTRVRVLHDNRRVTGYVYREVDGTKKVYGPNEVIWHKYPNLNNQFAALSPIAVLRLGLDTKAGMERYNRAFFNNYGAPSVTLETGQSVDPATAASVLRSFERSTRGADRAHSTVILPDGFKANVLGLSHKDAEFIEGGKVKLVEVCMGYKVPPTLIGYMEHATMNNVDAYEKAFYNRAIIPAFSRYMSVLNERLLPLFEKPGSGYYLEGDFSGIEALRADELNKWRVNKLKVDTRVYQRNEIRLEEGLKELPGLDDQPIAPAPIAAVPAELPEAATARDTQPAEESSQQRNKRRDFGNRPTVKLSKD